MITLQRIPNSLEARKRERREVPWNAGATVLEHVPEDWPVDADWYCIRSGGLVEFDRWESVRPVDGDELIFVRRPEGIGAFLLTTLGAALTGGEVTLTGAGLVAAFLIDTAIVTGLSYAASRLVGQPDHDHQLLDATDGKVYTFDGVQTVARYGDPIPVIYGRHAVGGNVLYAFVRSNRVESDAQTSPPIGASRLYFAIAFCEGPVADIEGHLLDGLDSDELAERVVNYLGEDDPDELDASLQVSGSTGITSAIGQELVNPGINYPEADDDDDAVTTTTQEPARAALVVISHPNGLYQSSSFAPSLVQWQTRFRDEGASVWSEWQTWGLWQAVGQSFQSEVFLEFEDFQVREIQVRKYTPDQDPAVASEPVVVRDLVLDSIIELPGEAYASPGLAWTAYLIPGGLTKSRTNIPAVATTIRGRIIHRYDPDSETWIPDAPNYSNPAWVAIDILTNPRFGTGAHFDRDTDFDLVEWAAFSDYCDELVDDGAGGTEVRHRFDGVFEGRESVWDAVLRVLGNARASITFSGYILQPVWSRPRAHTQIINSSHIIDGTFQARWIDNRKAPNRIDVRFLNEDANWGVDVAPVFDVTAIDRGEPIRIAPKDAFGITRFSEATRHGKYLINLERLTTRVFSFEMDASALQSQVKDLVKINHDVPRWGVAGGRITAATDSTLTIDADVTFNPGVTYQVEVVLEDDSRETRQITSPAGTYTAGTPISVEADWTTVPTDVARYNLGELNQTGYLAEIVAVRLIRDEDTGAPRLAVSCVNHDPAVFDDSVAAIDPPIESLLPDPGQIPACPVAAPVVNPGPEGALVFWTYPAPTPGGARLYVRPTALGGAWQLAGSVDAPATSHLVTGLTPGVQYDLTVIFYSTSGAQKQPGDCSFSTFVYDVSGAVPARVEDVGVLILGDELLITWDPVPGATSYEVRRGGGDKAVLLTGWVLSRPVGTTGQLELQTTRWAPTGSGDEPGVERIMVRAISPSGLYGPMGAVDVDLGATWYGGTPATRDEFTLGWPGTLTNLTETGDGFLELTSRSTPGMYETPAIDLGSIATRRIGAVLWAEHLEGPDVDDLAWTPDSLTGKQWSAEGFIAPALWPSSVVAEVRVADTEGGLASAVYGALVTGNRTGRWMQIRVTVETTDSEWNPTVRYLFTTAEPT